jgi:hypothetical protein
MHSESLYALLPDQGRQEIRDALESYLSPGAIELVTPQYRERLARAWHQERGEGMVRDALGWTR